MKQYFNMKITLVLLLIFNKQEINKSLKKMENNFFSFFFHFFSIQITNLILQNIALAHQFFLILQRKN